MRQYIKSIHRLKLRVFLIAVSFAVAHLCSWLLPEAFEKWDNRVVDRLFQVRATAKQPYPVDDSSIVHINFNFYLNRSYHAQVVQNLASMHVAAQLFDFIFDSKSVEDHDRALIEATSLAGKVYFGMEFDWLGSNPESAAVFAKGIDHVAADLTKWHPVVYGDITEFFVGQRPRITYAAMAEAARGIGFLNLKHDRDGVFRRLPLLVRVNGGFFPSLPFRAVCDYLGVAPSQIILRPGKSITLKDARRPGASSVRDIVIPIDRRGNMRINFTDLWKRIPHLNYSDFISAPAEFEKRQAWEKQLSGKIVVISEDATGSSNIGPVSGNNRFPINGLHADVIHTILSESFVKELSNRQMVIIEAALLLSIMFLSLRVSALPFTYGTILLAGGYAGLAALLFFTSNVILNMARPLLMAVLAMLMIQVIIVFEKTRLYAETKRARDIAERELEIARQIQSGFFPDRLPELPGWEIAVHFQAARQVAGDFYDAFTLDEGKKVGLIIADVCDKGVGAALFMALFRSLLRAFAGQRASPPPGKENTNRLFPEMILERTVLLVNDYIAETHGREDIFATLFFGILDPPTGTLDYINAGHEPPAVLDAVGIKTMLNPTGPVVGAFPGMTFETGRIQLEPGEFLIAYTDGVIDAKNQRDAFLTREKVLGGLTQGFTSAQSLIDHIKAQIRDHIAGTQQYDDITVMVIRRQQGRQSLS